MIERKIFQIKFHLTDKREFQISSRNKKQGGRTMREGEAKGEESGGVEREKVIAGNKFLCEIPLRDSVLLNSS